MFETNRCRGDVIAHEPFDERRAVDVALKAVLDEWPAIVPRECGFDPLNRFGEFGRARRAVLQTILQRVHRLRQMSR
ncbi:hypothetical protein [Pandoraea sp. NPDC090278]|uniref:hypothetical protein n=1 Tax=Pandoraea sp. NPDC090278 TaxID=3364391 RepID=UPI00383B2A29